MHICMHIGAVYLQEMNEDQFVKLHSYINHFKTHFTSCYEDFVLKNASLQFHAAVLPELHSGDPSELCESLVPAEAHRGPSACRPQGPKHDQPIDSEIECVPQRNKVYVELGGWIFGDFGLSKSSWNGSKDCGGLLWRTDWCWRDPTSKSLGSLAIREHRELTGANPTPAKNCTKLRWVWLFLRAFSMQTLSCTWGDLFEKTSENTEHTANEKAFCVEHFWGLYSYRCCCCCCCCGFDMLGYVC